MLFNGKVAQFWKIIDHFVISNHLIPYLRRHPATGEDIQLLFTCVEIIVSIPQIHWGFLVKLVGQRQSNSRILEPFFLNFQFLNRSHKFLIGVEKTDRSASTQLGESRRGSDWSKSFCILFDRVNMPVECGAQSLSVLFYFAQVFRQDLISSFNCTRKFIVSHWPVELHNHSERFCGSVQRLRRSWNAFIYWSRENSRFSGNIFQRVFIV